MTTFGDKVYEIVRKIPRGEVATYGQIATLAGSPRAARAVGMMLKKNPDIQNTPLNELATKIVN